MFVASTVFPSAAKIFPRSIVNCATTWIAFSLRLASPGAAHDCQYVVARINAPSSASANTASREICPFNRVARCARLETSSSSASRMKFASRLEPP